MGIGRGKKAFNADSIIYSLGKGGKFSAMHRFAYILTKTPLESSLLCRAGWHTDAHLLIGLLDLISDQYTPGKQPQSLGKTLKTLLLNLKPSDQVMSSHTANFFPYLFVDPLSKWLVKAIININKPESVNNTIVPKQKFYIFL